MQFSSFGSFLVRCFAALSLISIAACNGLASFDVEVWVDSLTKIAQSYEELLAQASKYRIAESSFSIGSTDCDIGRREDEAILDCLANRLLAEEYQPYDFDIRETIWCKGSPVTDIKFDSQLSNTLFAENSSSLRSALSGDSESEFQNRWLPFLWLEYLQIGQSELRCRISSQIEESLSYFSGVDRNDVLLALNNETPPELNEMQDDVSLQGIFGSTVIPNSIQITDADYATIAIQSWNEIQILAKENWAMIEFRINQLRPISGFQFQDLAKSMLRNFRIAQR